MKNPRKILLITLVFLVLGAVHLTIHTHNMHLNYEVEQLKKILNELYNKNRVLSLQVAQKSSLERIEKIAVQSLNMVYPKEMNYIIK
jgi:cell division protein FtsL